MRVFAAASIDRFTPLQELMSELSKIKECRVVKTPQLHLTFRFFGEIDGEVLANVRNEFRKIPGKRFSLEIQGLGAFPDRSRANVMFLHAENNKEIMFNYDCISSIPPIVKDLKKFIPHITIARFKNRHDCRELCSRFDGLSYTGDITRLSLYKSELRGEGPVYTEIERVQL